MTNQERCAVAALMKSSTDLSVFFQGGRNLRPSAGLQQLSPTAQLTHECSRSIARHHAGEFPPKENSKYSIKINMWNGWQDNLWPETRFIINLQIYCLFLSPEPSVFGNLWRPENEDTASFVLLCLGLFWLADGSCSITCFKEARWEVAWNQGWADLLTDWLWSLH